MKMLKMLFLNVILLFDAVLSLNPVVETPLGKIEGYFSETINGRQFIAFEGVPYAKPPVGKYRFFEPIPVEPWKETLKANTLHKCIQYNHYSEPGEDPVLGEEDCLYVNIYTPNTNKHALMDVLIFIHGGAFMFNHGGKYGPKIILNRDVLLVTLNYRLGPIGFLSTEDKVVPGNNGLKDQSVALKWIKNNIQYFGGNPDAITLSGMSAGGASAQLHALSPLSKGLFNRGFSQSGTALNAWVLVENSLQKSKQIAMHVGCPISNTEVIVNCLRKKPAYDIVDAVRLFQPWLYNPFSPFGIVIDKWSTDPFLPEHPYILLTKKKVQDLPWIFSNTESEGLYPAADFIGEPIHLNAINTHWNELIPHILDFNNTLSVEEKSIVVKKIRDFYFADKPVSKETYKILLDVISDRMFKADIEIAARLHSAAVKSAVYYYQFTYRGAHSKSELRSGSNENYGASHGDDTIYVLSSDVDSQTTERDREMSRISVDLWTSFMKTGVPQINNIKWPPMSKKLNDNLIFLLIQSPSNFSINSESLIGNRQFWENLPFKENKNLFPQKDEL